MKNTIAVNLQKLRKLNKYSQEYVAEMISVSRQAVASWENADTTPDIYKCQSLAELYDISLDDLMNYSEEKNKLPLPPKGKHLFGSVTIGERGQIVIPKKARDIFGLKSGDDLIVLGDEPQGLALMKADYFFNMAEQMKQRE